MKLDGKDIIKIIVTFIVGVVLGFIVYKFGSFSITDAEQAALNGIIWLLFVVIGLLCVAVVLLFQHFYTVKITRKDSEITGENLSQEDENQSYEKENIEETTAEEEPEKENIN